MRHTSAASFPRSWPTVISGKLYQGRLLLDAVNQHRIRCFDPYAADCWTKVIGASG